MFKSKKILVKCNFVSVLIICNLVRLKATKNPLRDIWISESAKCRSSVLPDLEQSLVGGPESPRKTEIERFKELRDELFEWDRKQEEFVHELFQSPPRGLACDEQESADQEAGKNPQRLPSENNRYSQHLSELIEKEKIAEKKREDALKAANSREFEPVISYLRDERVLESHFTDLLPSLPLGRQIRMLEIDGKRAVQLTVEAIQNSYEKRHEILEFLLNREAEYRLIQGRRTTRQNEPLVVKYLEMEFADYSRILLSILEEASRKYQWTFSEIKPPSTWFSSIISDERSVLSDRISSLRELQMGDVKMAKEHLMKAKNTQDSIDKRKRNLYHMGLRGWTLNNDSKYLKLRVELNEAQAKWSQPPIENLGKNLRALTAKRIEFEQSWNHEVTPGSINESKHPSLISPFFADLMVSCMKGLLGSSIEAFGNELKAREEFIKGNPFKSHNYFLKATEYQIELESWIGNFEEGGFTHFHWNEATDYGKLLSIEKKVLEMEADVLKNDLLE